MQYAVQGWMDSETGNLVSRHPHISIYRQMQTQGTVYRPLAMMQLRPVPTVVLGEVRAYHAVASRQRRAETTSSERVLVWRKVCIVFLSLNLLFVESHI